MVHSASIITVFVASPADLEAERNALEEVVQELNRTWTRKGVSIDLLRWETNTFPGIGESAQQVINEQIADKYDIFVGMMWGRYGQPTDRAGSGTEEEFNRALEHRKANADVSIMFYFKDAPISPSHIDPDQIAQIGRFKERLSAEGVLFRLFETPQQLALNFRMYMSQVVQQMQAGGAHKPIEAASIPRKPEAPPSSNDSAVEEDDAGILDLLEIAESRLESTNEIMDRIAEATTDLQASFQRHTAEITAAIPNASTMSTTMKRRLVNRAAEDLSQYAERTRAQIPLLRESYSAGIQALGKAMAMSIEQSEQPETHEAAGVVQTLERALSEGLESVRGFRETLRQLPRMTTRLNGAKTSAIAVLDELIQALEAGLRDTGDAGTALVGIYPSP